MLDPITVEVISKRLMANAEEMEAILVNMVLAADIRADYVRTALGLTRQTPAAEMAEVWADLETRAQDWLAGQGIPPAKRLLQRIVDMRYLGQNFERPVPASSGAWTGEARAELESRVHAAHGRTYGYAAPDEVTQIVNYRVTAYGLAPHVTLRQHDAATAGPDGAVVGQRLSTGDAARRRRPRRSTTAPGSSPATRSWVRRSSTSWTR